LASRANASTRSVSSPRHERRAVDPDEVAEVQRQQELHLLVTQHVDARLELDPPRPVLEIQECHLALAASRGETTGDAVRDVGLLARRQALVGGADRRDGLDPAELMRERLDPGCAQRLELAPTVGEDVREPVPPIPVGLFTHGPSPPEPRRRRRSW
jgi:hypothetical protein